MIFVSFTAKIFSAFCETVRHAFFQTSTKDKTQQKLERKFSNTMVIQKARKTQSLANARIIFGMDVCNTRFDDVMVDMVDDIWWTLRGRCIARNQLFYTKLLTPADRRHSVDSGTDKSLTKHYDAMGKT